MILFQMRDYVEFFEAVATVKEKLSIKNSAVALLELLRRGMGTLQSNSQRAEAIPQ